MFPAILFGLVIWAAMRGIGSLLVTLAGDPFAAYDAEQAALANTSLPRHQASEIRELLPPVERGRPTRAGG